MPTSRRFGGSSSTMLVADHDVAFALRDEARDDAQQRGLAAARRAEQRDQLAAP